MKLKGKKISGKNIEYCIIPRSDGENIVFKCQSVMDLSDFDKLCPEPHAPLKMLPGKGKVRDVEAPSYKVALEKRNEKRIYYITLKSLEATEELEWETVNMSDSSTWGNYETELRDSGFSNIEIMRIVNACMSANCLNEAKLEEARNSFLASQLALEPAPSSLSTEP